MAGWCLQLSGDLTNAAVFFHRAVRLAPENRAVILEYARFLTELERWELAARQFETGLALPPPDGQEASQTWADRWAYGACLIEAGEPVAAERVFREMLSGARSGKDRVSAAKGVWAALGAQGRHDDARRFWKRHIEPGPVRTVLQRLGERLRLAPPNPGADAASTTMPGPRSQSGDGSGAD